MYFLCYMNSKYLYYRYPNSIDIYRYNTKILSFKIPASFCKFVHNYMFSDTCISRSDESLLSHLSSVTMVTPIFFFTPSKRGVFRTLLMICFDVFFIYCFVEWWMILEQPVFVLYWKPAFVLIIFRSWNRLLVFNLDKIWPLWTCVST